MSDYYANLQANQDLSISDQKKAGKAIAGDMGDEHKDFVKLIESLIKNNEIDVHQPETFLNRDIYDSLDADWKAKTDVAMVNIADLLRHISEFYASKQTPDSSPQLESMIEQLWEMKQRIESHADVFKF